MTAKAFDEEAAINSLVEKIRHQVDCLVAEGQSHPIRRRTIRYRLLEAMAATYGKWDDDNEQGPVGRETGG